MICAKEGKGALALLKFMPAEIYKVLGKMAIGELLKVEELRMGAEKPIVVVNGNGCYYVNVYGELISDNKSGVRVSARDLEELFRLLCDGSVYAVEENIKNGFITANGGHRVGICGTFTYQNNRIESVRNISYINIRIAREVIGAAEGVVDIITDKGLQNTLIVSPPGGGKTTLLRDICRLLGGDGFHYKVAVADERGEIAATYMGRQGNNIGPRTCVIDGCPKAVAMEMLLRGMGPDVVITDEIGNEDDERAVKRLLGCGIKVIASAHGKNFDDVKKRMPFCADEFEKVIVLDKKQVSEVICFGA